MASAKKARRRDTRLTGAGERIGHGAFAARRGGQGMCPGAADVVLVLGDIGEMRKKPEGANDLKGLGRRQAVQRRFELAARRDILVSAEADRALANMFDGAEDCLAALLARTVSPRMRPSSRISSRNGRSLSSVLIAFGFGTEPPFAPRSWMVLAPRCRNCALPKQ
jgi:hypothetical protein